MERNRFEKERYSIEKDMNEVYRQEAKGDGKRWPGCIAIDRGCFSARVIHCIYLSARRIESAIQRLEPRTVFLFDIRNALISSKKRQSEIIGRLNEIASALNVQPTTGENIEEVLVGGLYWFPTDLWEENIVVPVLVKGVHNDEADVETVFVFDHERDDCLSVPCKSLFRTKQAALSYIAKTEPGNHEDAPALPEEEEANG